MRYYRCGDNFLFQLNGVPIGGPLCGTILEGVLGKHETDFEDAHAFVNANIIKGRIADDVLLASFNTCCCCLSKLIPKIYGDAIHLARRRRKES